MQGTISWRSAGALAALAAVASLVNAAPAGAAERSVAGAWVGALPCVFNNPLELPGALADPTKAPYHCTGSTTWTGTWNGQTVFEAEGTTNALTGENIGVIYETWRGVTSDGRLGTLYFEESFTIDASAAINIAATIVGASGEVAGAHGQVTFTGTSTPLGQGAGSYQGHWSLPSTAAARRRAHARLKRG
jgi:hypothetical protein